MKRLYKIFATWFLCLFLVLSQFIVSLADVKSLMIGSGSNALMTMQLDDLDYVVMPRSSIGTVTNTVTGQPRVVILYRNSNGILSNWYVEPEYRDGRFYVQQEVPGQIFYIAFGFYKESLPAPGGYVMSFDFGSTFSVDYSAGTLRLNKQYTNAEPLQKDVSIPYQQNSGDIYVSSVDIDLSNLNWLQLLFNIDDYFNTDLRILDGSFALNFVRSAVGDSAIDTGFDTSTIDYQNEVSSSLSGLSSSVDSMTDEISGVTEAIQNLQGAMEPHYSNVLTQLHHITEQLHAFYDQVYNNIHLKEYALWQDIKTAIENIDLEVNVNLDKLKTSIDNMSTAVQNKLQSVSDHITGGFDNSGMNQENEKLEQSINQYDEVESGIFEDAEGFIGDFEYPSVDNLPLGIIKALSFIGSILQGIFLSMGDFSIIITFSLTMIFVMVIVGYHRIRS